MSDDIQAFLLFCEDFRVEEGAKPMMIGVLAPVFYTSIEPGISDKIYLVTLVNAAEHVESVDLTLEVVTSRPNADDDGQAFRQSVMRPDEAEPGEGWSATLPLPLQIPEWLDGTTIKARLKAGEFETRASVRARVLNEKQLREIPPSGGKPKGKTSRARRKS